MTKYLDKEKVIEQINKLVSIQNNIYFFEFLNNLEIGLKEGNFDIEPDKDKHTIECVIKNLDLFEREIIGVSFDDRYNRNYDTGIEEFTLWLEAEKECICKEGVPRETK